MDEAHSSSNVGIRSRSRRGWRRFVLAGLVALPLLLTQGSESAEASCTYNIGSGSDHGFSFRSHWSDFGGYGSWDLHAGQSQCWYANGWDSGWFGPPDCWLNCDSWPSDLNIGPHGWINICAYDTSGTGPQWLYYAFHTQDRTPGYGQSDYGPPPGCTEPSGSSAVASQSRARAPTELASKRRPVNTDSSLSTGRAPSLKVRSVTFHMHGASGKPLGSVCMPPVSVSHVDLSLARRRGVRKVFVGIREQGNSCAHPKVAGRERAGKPRPDSRFAHFCQGTGGRVVRTFRYPDDFTRSKRPPCRSTG